MRQISDSTTSAALLEPLHLIGVLCKFSDITSVLRCCACGQINIGLYCRGSVYAIRFAQPCRTAFEALALDVEQHNVQVQECL